MMVSRCRVLCWPSLTAALGLMLNATTRGEGPLAGEVADLRARISTQITRELTEHWYPATLDREHGGFHQNLARDWSPRPDSDKFAVYQARMTWTAAAFAGDPLNRNNRDEFRDYARWGLRCLDETLRDREQGGFHWSVGLDGRVDAQGGAEKHVYGTAFVLYAASKVFEATHEPRALVVARDAFEWLESKAHDARNGGYHESLTRAGVPILAWDRQSPPERRVDRVGVYHGFKSMNAHIHLLEALAEYHRVAPTPVVTTRLEEVLAIVRDKIAAEPGALNLYLSADWHPAPAHDSFGHDIETAYLLVEAASALGRPNDTETWRVARSLVDHALDWGWDRTNGGFYDKGDVFNGQPYDTTKVWWTQAEGLNALLVMHRKYGHETRKYWEAFRLQWAFIEKFQIDARFGGWFWETSATGTPSGIEAKATPWKANYHTGRALLNVARMLDEIEPVRPALKAP